MHADALPLSRAVPRPANTGDTSWPLVWLIALGLEALLLVGGGAWLSQSASAPAAEKTVEISLAEPAPPAPPQEKPKPLPPVPVKQPRVVQHTPQLPLPAPVQVSDNSAAAVPAAPPPAPAQDYTAAHEAEFATKLRAAIQNAVVYPSAARLSRLAGKAKVEFLFRDGVSRNPHIVQSSGSGLLDQAAIAAVGNAVSPPVPDSLRGRELIYQVTVVFEMKTAF